MTGALLILSADGKAGLDDLSALGAVVVAQHVPSGGARAVLDDPRIAPWLDGGAIVALDFADVADVLAVEAAIEGARA